MTWKGWTVLIFAVWLIIAAFIPGVVGSSSANLTNFLIAGIVFIAAGLPMLRNANKTAAWIILISGVWLLISAFIPGVTGSKAGAMTNDLLFGILTAIFAFFDRKSSPEVFFEQNNNK
ncbi:SPW repeat domain-containing protein [Marinitoga aeolica]|uniref:SPW repeat protein n=1 Tax=Marinitoga aeolica TaxID=2809031 RepID=A0ABY8PNY8_9BACT|nr:SPW repeat protein [Marinitoga aeolica]WGS64330.1 SPW repeat protein [Marinitoga aeolica]